MFPHFVAGVITRLDSIERVAGGRVKGVLGTGKRDGGVWVGGSGDGRGRKVKLILDIDPKSSPHKGSLVHELVVALVLEALG